jgi:hypothetical protein
VLWCIWKRRNKQISKDDAKQIWTSVEQALDFLDNWEIEYNKKVSVSTETCITRKVLKANEIENLIHVRTHWDTSSLNDFVTLQDDKIITGWNVNSAMTPSACITISRAR